MGLKVVLAAGAAEKVDDFLTVFCLAHKPTTLRFAADYHPKFVGVFNFSRIDFEVGINMRTLF